MFSALVPEVFLQLVQRLAVALGIDGGLLLEKVQRENALSVKKGSQHDFLLPSGLHGLDRGVAAFLHPHFGLLFRFWLKMRNPSLIGSHQAGQKLLSAIAVMNQAKVPLADCLSTLLQF